MRHSVTVLLLVTTLLAAGCAAFGDKDKDETKNWSAQRLYSEAKDELNSGNYERAVKLFETLEARYPFGRFAQQAQLEMAYAYYRDNEPAQAIAAAERFIKLHPNHPNVDYAYYLRGLATFGGDLGLFSFLTNEDVSDRDPKGARESFDAFKELVTRYPNSKYASDAAARMSYLTNALAQHEVHVARYYYKRGAYIAAVSRAQAAVEGFPQTPAIEEALYVMVKAYERMGLKDLQADAERVLKLNFPQSAYVTGNYEKSPWWKFWKSDQHKIYN